MDLQCNETFRHQCIGRVSRQVAWLSTEIARGVLILQTQHACNNLELDLGRPLTLVPVLLPMMHHKCSWMVLQATLDAPIAKKTCQARLLPQVFKLSGVQRVMYRPVHGQLVNVLEPHLELVRNKLRWNQCFLLAKHENHGKLTQQRAHMCTTLFMATGVALASMLGLNSLDEEPERFL
jgi:hypothetical protein